MQENIVTFINLGRHDEKQKRLSRIIKATKKLNEEGYIFRVIFIGDGPDSSKYKNEAKDIKNIEFTQMQKSQLKWLWNFASLTQKEKNYYKMHL